MSTATTHPGYQLSPGQKNVVDTLLYILGALFGTGGAGLLFLLGHAPMWVLPLGGVVGAGVGYAISDAISFVNTGTLPQPISATLLALWQNQGYAAAQAYVAKLSPAYQTIANAILAELQAQLPKATTA